MDVYFCHHCRQSIPLKDIQSGSAARRGGRYYCVTCKLLPREERSPILMGVLAAGLLVALVALVVQYGSVLGLSGSSSGESAPQAAVAEPPALPPAEDLRNLLAQSEESLRSRADALDRRLADLVKRWENHGEGLNLVRGKLDLFEARFRDLDRQSEQLRLAEDRMRGVLDRLQALTGEVQSVQGALLELRAGVKAGAAPSPSAPPESPPADPVQEEIRGWLRDAKDRSAMKRFNAVAELARHDAAEARAAVIAALRDEDFFVRRLSADLLGDSRSEEPVPALIEALDDEEISVRAAAHGALKKLTRKDFNFQEGASAEDRARARKRWKEWWEKRSAAGK